jgi:4-amino-4-deoxy-L-arabinose transferase-like glycosyltransferase
MTEKSRFSRGFIGALTAFILATIYFGFTASHLPIGAGPDAYANYSAVSFYSKYKRLAVFPEDENTAEVDYSPHGTTRLLRPPLSFLVSALLTPVSPLGEKASRNVVGSKAWHKAPRIGPVLLCALTVAFVYLGLYWYFGNAWYAVVGSALTGLLPQFTFIASHLNDDSSAIFSATMLFAALILIYLRRTKLSTIVFLGLSVGLVLVSKLSAWLVLPTAGLAFLLFFRIEKKRWLPCGLILIAMTIIGGGWWPLFNMFHYGIDDYRASNIQREIATRHKNLKPLEGRGFIAQGIGFYQLGIRNHGNFIGASIKSAIGNLGWLELRLSPVQYTPYYAVLILAVLYYLMRVLFVSVRCWTGMQEATDTRRFIFETLLVGAIVFQALAYTYRNVYQDIQVQGKYLLPIILPLLVLFLAATRVMSHTLATWLRAAGLRSITLPSHNIPQAVALLCLFTFGLVHLDGVLRRVLPYYWPPAYSLNTSDFEFLNLDQALWTELHKDISITIQDGAWHIQSAGEDPQLILPGDICNQYGKNFLVRVDLVTDEGCYGSYVRNNPDLLTAYKVSERAQSIEAWGKSHYNTYGKAEGRGLPVACSNSVTMASDDMTPAVDTTGEVVKSDRILAIYVDDGKGFRPDFRGPAAQIKYRPGNQSVVLGLAAQTCKRLRLDPMVGPGQMAITAIGFSKVKILPPWFLDL